MEHLLSAHSNSSISAGFNETVEDKTYLRVKPLCGILNGVSSSNVLTLSSSSFCTVLDIFNQHDKDESRHNYSHFIDMVTDRKTK